MAHSDTRSPSSHRLRLTPEEATRVYRALLAGNVGEERALGIAIRNMSREGQRPVYTPSLTRQIKRKIVRILKDSQ